MYIDQKAYLHSPRLTKVLEQPSQTKSGVSRAIGREVDGEIYNARYCTRMFHFGGKVEKQ